MALYIFYNRTPMTAVFGNRKHCWNWFIKNSMILLFVLLASLVLFLCGRSFPWLFSHQQTAWQLGLQYRNTITVLLQLHHHGNGIFDPVCGILDLDVDQGGIGEAYWLRAAAVLSPEEGWGWGRQWWWWWSLGPAGQRRAGLGRWQAPGVCSSRQAQRWRRGEAAELQLQLAPPWSVQLCTVGGFRRCSVSIQTDWEILERDVFLGKSVLWGRLLYVGRR